MLLLVDTCMALSDVAYCTLMTCNQRLPRFMSVLSYVTTGAPPPPVTLVPHVIHINVVGRRERGGVLMAR
jgi:hypothetical protein